MAQTCFSTYHVKANILVRFFFSPARTVFGRYSLLLKGLRCFWSSHLAIIIWPFQKSLRSARLPIFLTSHGLSMITTVLLCGIQTWKNHTFWSRSTATRIKKYSSKSWLKNNNSRWDTNFSHFLNSDSCKQKTEMCFRKTSIKQKNGIKIDKANLRWSQGQSST